MAKDTALLLQGLGTFKHDQLPGFYTIFMMM